MRFVCVNFLNHLHNMMHSHSFFVESTFFLNIEENNSRIHLRKRDASKNEKKTNEMKENETKKNETKKNKRNDNTNDLIALWINSAKKFSLKRDLKKLKTFFTNASDVITMFLNMNDENDENNYVSNENFKITNDDVDEIDNEIWSKEKTTKIVLRFFFRQMITSSKKRKQRKLFFDFFLFLSMTKQSKRKKQRKLFFNFSSFLLNAKWETTIWRRFAKAMMTMSKIENSSTLRALFNDNRNHRLSFWSNLNWSILDWLIFLEWIFLNDFLRLISWHDEHSLLSCFAERIVAYFSTFAQSDHARTFFLSISTTH
jgi:hypothetical protein